MTTTTTAISEEPRIINPKTIGGQEFYALHDIERPAHPRPYVANSKRCSRKCCMIGGTLGVIFGLLVIGAITYIIMVHESQCYRGCQRVCKGTQMACRSECWSDCWRAEWSECPEHGQKVCSYIMFDKAVVHVFGQM